jgi:hypothetical protein
MIIRVKDDEILAIAHPDRDGELLEALGQVQAIWPGGVVEPASPLRRAAFRVVRGLLGGLRPVREWTRRWPGPWRVRMPDGQILGPFADREEAIRAEEEALAQLLAREGTWRP